MKKIMVIASMLIMTAVAGCGKSTIQTSNETNNEIVKETILEETVLEEKIVSEEYLTELEYNSRSNGWE